MPRYFFDISDGRDIRGTEGFDLADLRTAQAEAAKRAGALLMQHASEFWNGCDWSIDITNADRVVLCTLHFIAITGSPLRANAYQELWEAKPFANAIHKA